MTKSKLRQKLNLSEAVEDYLKAIYLIREEESTDNTPTVLVTTNALAARLEVAPGSVTGMIKKLVEHHLVRHLPYHGVELTDIGEHLALELVRHHRLIELYLTHVVGFSWDEVHEQADALEHAISEIEQKLPRERSSAVPCPDRADSRYRGNAASMRTIWWPNHAQNSGGNRCHMPNWP